MGCSECSRETRGKSTCTNPNCVIKIVKNIVKGQQKAAENNGGGYCATSCDQSIADLLSPSGSNDRPTRHTTIPFMLTCKASCKPFVGTGFRKARPSGAERSLFECVESPIFKARSFVKGTDSCVKLELLTPIYAEGSVPQSEAGGSFCDEQFDNRLIRNFRATGICITVDLNCFCGISCLDAITPRRNNNNMNS